LCSAKKDASAASRNETGEEKEERRKAAVFEKDVFANQKTDNGVSVALCPKLPAKGEREGKGV